jgi:hypothetical protein
MKYLNKTGLCQKFAILMIAASTTISAGNTEKFDHDYFTDTTEYNLAYQYPERNILLSIYKELKKQDVIRVGEGVLAEYDPFEEFVVDDEVMKNVYDWAIENKFISIEDVELIAQDIKEDNYDFFATKSVEACGVSIAACAGELIAAESAQEALPCVTAAVTAGTNPYADAWCAATMVGGALVVSAACKTEIESECTEQPDPSIYNAGTAGNVTGKKRNGTCSVNGRVNHIIAWKRGQLIVKIKAYCTDGSNFTVGTGTKGTSWERECDNGSHVSGLYGRAGSHIDAISIHCDEALTADTSLDPQGLIGGNGGSRFDLVCPNGTGHLYGINARETNHALKKKRKLNSVTALCKNF